jgi:hypothetical protein
MSTNWVACSHGGGTCPRPPLSILASCEHSISEANVSGEGMPPSVIKGTRS